MIQVAFGIIAVALDDAEKGNEEAVDWLIDIGTEWLGLLNDEAGIVMSWLGDITLLAA